MALAGLVGWRLLGGGRSSIIALVTEWSRHEALVIATSVEDRSSAMLALIVLVCFLGNARAAPVIRIVTVLLCLLDCLARLRAVLAPAPLYVSRPRLK